MDPVTTPAVTRHVPMSHVIAFTPCHDPLGRDLITSPRPRDHLYTVSQPLTTAGHDPAGTSPSLEHVPPAQP